MYSTPPNFHAVYVGEEPWGGGEHVHERGAGRGGRPPPQRPHAYRLQADPLRRRGPHQVRAQQ